MFQISLEPFLSMLLIRARQVFNADLVGFISQEM